MTDSMIPYSFVPGTKAKASEVNANFISLANAITQNSENLTNNVEEINQALADINDTLDEEHFEQETITQTSTDLNDYKRKGIYFFDSAYTPTNIPKGDDGALIVLGESNIGVKQIWISGGTNPEIFTRSYSNSSWSSWNSILGEFVKGNPYYLKMPNGMMLQFGYGSRDATITYPLAYDKMPSVIATKQGYSPSDNTTDEGFYTESPTGFTYTACGYFNGGFNWIAIGV